MDNLFELYRKEQRFRKWGCEDAEFLRQNPRLTTQGPVLLMLHAGIMNELLP